MPLTSSQARAGRDRLTLTLALGVGLLAAEGVRPPLALAQGERGRTSGGGAEVGGSAAITGPAF